MKLAIIGLGKMGTALLQGILNSGLYQAKELVGSDLYVEDTDSNEKYFGIQTMKDNIEAVNLADTILLAVKPQVIPKVASKIAKYTANKLIISIAAGLNLENLSKQLVNSARIVRVMPNTPALVGEGAAAFTSGSDITTDDRKIVKDILQSVGEVVEVEEKLMDAVTGLSGSGPAYVYMIIEAMADGGVLMGLPRDMAQKLAAQTVLGSAKMIMETGKHPGELKDAVASPGGTTIRAIEKLEEKGLRSSLIEAVKASAERSKELNDL